LFGDPPFLWSALPHPVAIIGNIGSFLERKLNRERRSQRARLFRGAFVAAVMTLGAVAIGIGAIRPSGIRIEIGKIAQVVAAHRMLDRQMLKRCLIDIAAQDELQLADRRRRFERIGSSLARAAASSRRPAAAAAACSTRRAVLRMAPRIARALMVAPATKSGCWTGACWPRCS
jgi:hypothetical protein